MNPKPRQSCLLLLFMPFSYHQSPLPEHCKNVIRQKRYSCNASKKMFEGLGKSRSCLYHGKNREKSSHLPENVYFLLWKGNPVSFFATKKTEFHVFAFWVKSSKSKFCYRLRCLFRKLRKTKSTGDDCKFFSHIRIEKG